MKTALVLLALLLTASCATTKDGFVNDTIHQCAPGDPVSIEAGVEALDGDLGDRSEITTERLMVRVRVTNLTDDDIEVTAIRTEQNSETTAYRIENAYRKFNETIPEGEDHIFEIPSNGQRTRTSPGYVTTRRVELTVTVQLASGDVYRCRFAV
ncbi:MAG TPA: hypothetical protein VEK57_29250 [Thermoanaerobaculia bacterium]|nr:hypothetical protein [Thermoanaerobaculia bacterium]